MAAQRSVALNLAHQLCFELTFSFALAGLTIFCLVPTTLGIGIALVRSCKGNEAIAVLLTVGTNMLGVFLMPPYIK